MAELVDAQDLKSCENQPSCRFKSGLRHHFLLVTYVALKVTLCYNYICDIYMEEYPSLVEGTGLENREVVRAAQGFESLFLRHFISRDGAVW